MRMHWQCSSCEELTYNPNHAINCWRCGELRMDQERKPRRRESITSIVRKMSAHVEDLERRLQVIEAAKEKDEATT